MALRFGLNALCERPHCFLTALARVERWAGFYERRPDAMRATVGYTILTGMAAMHYDLAVRAADDHLLHPKSKFLYSFWPSPARTSHGSNSPAHNAMF